MFVSLFLYPPSIVMTTCSSVAALGLMPLLLYIFCQGFSGLENAVPYIGIITALVYTLVPCAIGILINHYKPNYSSAVKKVRLLKSSAAVTLFTADVLTLHGRKLRQCGSLNNLISSHVFLKP